ncbi:MAG: hypothetical protein GY801_16520 [bacterium]|nr:hypothetical protein [bacterium]
MQQYDVATKVLMERAAEQMLEQFLGLSSSDIELIEELPQESANLKRSDYILRVTDNEGQTAIVLWEFLSEWKRRAILSLCDYAVRAKIKFALPLRPVVLLLRSSPQATDRLDEDCLQFRFTLIRLYTMSARTFLQQADIHLFPFVPVMQGEPEDVREAEQRIYQSSLTEEDKADLLTAMTIFAGLKDRNLARQLVERRRDIMIQSAAYDIIKQEGFEEGKQIGIQQGRQQMLQSQRKAIAEILETRLGVVPLTIVKALKTVEDTDILEELHRKALTVDDLQAFQAILTQILAPVSPA